MGGRGRRAGGPASTARSRVATHGRRSARRVGGGARGHVPAGRAVLPTGLAKRESAAKSQTASRSCSSADQRNEVVFIFPDCRVDGGHRPVNTDRKLTPGTAWVPGRRHGVSFQAASTRPAMREIQGWGTGRDSPRSRPNNRAARRAWARGRDRKMWASACSRSRAAIWASRAWIWATIAVNAATNAPVTAAAAAPAGPLTPGAAASRWAFCAAGPCGRCSRRSAARSRGGTG